MGRSQANTADDGDAAEKNRNIRCWFGSGSNAPKNMQIYRYKICTRIHLQNGIFRWSNGHNWIPKFIRLFSLFVKFTVKSSDNSLINTIAPERTWRKKHTHTTKIWRLDDVPEVVLSNKSPTAMDNFKLVFRTKTIWPRFFFVIFGLAVGNSIAN